MQRRFILGAALACLGTGAQLAQAQDFPSRPITLVAPFPAGSVTDSVTRLLAQGLQEVLGQTVVVDNKAGAQGTVGAAFVARAKPDGYTLLMASSGMFVAKSFYKSLPYDPNEALQPVTGVGSTSMMFMVADNSPFKSMQDVTRAIAAGGAPVTMGYGSPSGQLAVSLYSRVAKVNPVAVSYKGIPQALTDLAGGHVKLAIVDIGTGVAQIKSGKMRALAISAAARSGSAPGVPTLQEAFPDVGVSLETLIAVQAPAHTPAAVVERLDKALRSVLARPEVKARLASVSITEAPLSTAELTARIKSDNPKWESLMKAAGIEPQ